MTLYTSRIKSELDEKYSAREMEKMWSQLWTLTKIVFVFQVLYWSYGSPTFYLFAAIAVLIGIYYLNRIK